MIVHEVFIDPFDYEVTYDLSESNPDGEFNVFRLRHTVAAGHSWKHYIGGEFTQDRPLSEYSTHSYDEMVAHALRQERGEDV